MKKLIFFPVLGSTLALSLLACDDETTQVPLDTTVQTIGSIDKISCGKDNEGFTYLDQSSATLYTCTDGEFKKINSNSATCSMEPTKKGYKFVCNGDSVGVIYYDKLLESLDDLKTEGSSCSASDTTAKDGSKGFAITCDNKVQGVVWNGKDGSSCTVKDTVDSKTKNQGLAVLCDGKVQGVVWNGKNGKNGDNGSCCSVKDTVDSKTKNQGLAVLCDGEVSGVVWNGKDGSSGKPDSEGKGCEIIKDEDGIVSIDCNGTVTKLYKALCNGDVYEPEESFCFENKVYERCGGKQYNVTKEFCVDGNKVYTKCAHMSDDNNAPRMIYDTYNPETEYCADIGESYTTKRDIYETCLGVTIDTRTSTDSCYTRYIDIKDVHDADSVKMLIPKTCGGKSYNAYNQMCDTRDNQIYDYIVLPVQKDNKDTFQIWMAQNLNYRPIDGATDFIGKDQYGYSQYFSRSDDKSGLYDKNYGVLYTWWGAAALQPMVWKFNNTLPNDYDNTNGPCTEYLTEIDDDQNWQGICPDGWRLPSRTDFEYLTQFTNEELKSATDLWGGELDENKCDFDSEEDWAKPNCWKTAYKGTNTTELSVLPSSTAEPDNNKVLVFNGAHEAEFWVSTQRKQNATDEKACSWLGQSFAVNIYNDKNPGFSILTTLNGYARAVRCIK